MPTIEVDVRAAGLLAGLRNAEKATAYAVVNALNATAKDIQAEVRKGLKARFTVRKEQFIMRQAAIIRFANVKRGVMEAKVEVGKKSRLLLAEFEAGAARRPQRALAAIGEQRVGVPLAARPGAREVVPERLWLSRLKLARPLKRRGKKPTLPTQPFVIPGIAVLRRVAGQLQRLYTLAQDVRIPRRLGFYAAARSVTGARFSENLRKEVLKTLKFAFGRP